jgi:prepilin-type N-terminal cleavage/methylation domain-containing protein
MSATGNQGRGSLRDAGFTLFELLVALAITALLTGIAFPALQHQLARSAQIEARMTVKLALTQAHADAIAQDKPIRVSFSPARRMLQSSSGRPFMILPPQTSLEWPQEGFVFYADGTANGGTGAIQTASQSRRFYVDTATSRIVLEQ